MINQLISRFKSFHCSKHILTLLCFCFLITSVLVGCKMTAPWDTSDKSSGNEVPFITKTDFLLNTVVTINLYDKQDETILNNCFELIKKYEGIYSSQSATSELYALNHGMEPKEDGAFIVSDELADILKDGLHYSEISDGAFDISVQPITSLWDFISPNPVVPKDYEIKAALPNVNYKFIQLNGNKVTFTKSGVGIDLGAIAKGYIADRLKDYLLSKGVNSAMINLGGNVLCVGQKPDGTPFHVGIQKPFADRNVTVAIMDINDLSVVSSGVYERFFEVDGKLYHHILNPKTGYPYDNNLISVTIISKESTDGDGLSTTCFALGLEKGMALIESLEDTYAVFITSDYQIYYTKGLKEAIKVTEQ